VLYGGLFSVRSIPLDQRADLLLRLPVDVVVVSERLRSGATAILAAAHTRGSQMFESFS